MNRQKKYANQAFGEAAEFIGWALEHPQLRPFQEWLADAQAEWPGFHDATLRRYFDTLQELGWLRKSDDGIELTPDPV